MRLTRVTPPVEHPVSLQQARMQCHVDDDYEDALIQMDIDAAVSWLDGQHGVLRRCIVNQVWRADIERLGGYVALPFPDVSAVSALFTDDQAGTVVFDRTDCGGLRIRGGLDRPASITFTAGFGTPAEVPPAICRAVLLLTGHFFKVRMGEDSAGLPREVSELISPFRLLRV